MVGIINPQVGIGLTDVPESGRAKCLPPPMVPPALFTIHKDKDDDLAFLQCITFTHSFSKVLQAMLKKSVIFQTFLPNKEQCTIFFSQHIILLTRAENQFWNYSLRFSLFFNQFVIVFNNQLKIQDLLFPNWLLDSVSKMHGVKIFPHYIITFNFTW